MRIALFTDTYAPQVNGVAKTLKRLTNHFEKRGVQYQIFVPDVTDNDLFSSQVHRFTSFPFFLYPECRLALPNVFHIRKQLEQFKPDLIHIATPFNIGMCGVYYGKKLNIPIVGSYHTHFDQYLEYYDLQFLSKWIWRYMNWFHKPFLKTFVPSHETKQLLMRHGFSNIHLWKRGVDCLQFQLSYNTDKVRKKYKINKKHIFSFVGRLAPEKDLDILIEISQ